MAHKRCMLVFALLALPGVAANVSDGWRDRPDGGLRQANQEAEMTVSPNPIAGSGPAWRCIVVPGYQSGAAGIMVGPLTLGLESGDDKAALTLRLRPSGEILWADDFVNWQPYEPIWIEVVREAGRLYVQALSVLRGDLLAQSEWLETDLPETPSLTAFTSTMTADFSRLQVAAKALREPDPNSPSKLRLLQHGKTDWIVVGGGDWQWTDTTHRRLRLARPTERTMAYMSTPRSPEGIWRCRLRLDKDTCGGGMMVLADPEAETGFVCWLGGTYGDGGLMLYRQGVGALWSSPQGIWHWDTDYVLEATVSSGTVSTRLLKDDNETVLAASPEMPLTPEERNRTGLTGMHVWQGTGTFWGFSEGTLGGEETQAAAAASQEVTVSGDTFRHESGAWDWVDPQGKSLGGAGAPLDADQGPGLTCTANELNRTIGVSVRGAKGLFAADVTATENTAFVALLFQVSDDGKLGFECRFGQGCELRTPGGDILWRNPDLKLQSGQVYRIEGRIRTDRVMVRVLDQQGEELARSPDCYVPDTNNARPGSIGFAAQGGATFRNWSFTE